MVLRQFSFNFNQTLEKACNTGKYSPLLFLLICHFLSIWYFEEKLPQLLCHYHQSYVSFICEKIKQSVKGGLLLSA